MQPERDAVSPHWTNAVVIFPLDILDGKHFLLPLPAISTESKPSRRRFSLGDFAEELFVELVEIIAFSTSQLLNADFSFQVR